MSSILELYLRKTDFNKCDCHQYLYRALNFNYEQYCRSALMRFQLNLNLAAKVFSRHISGVTPCHLFPL